MRPDPTIEISTTLVEGIDTRSRWQRLLRRPIPKEPRHLGIVTFADGFQMQAPVADGLYEDTAIDLHRLLFEMADELHKRAAAAEPGRYVDLGERRPDGTLRTSYERWPNGAPT